MQSILMSFLILHVNQTKHAIFRVFSYYRLPRERSPHSAFSYFANLVSTLKLFINYAFGWVLKLQQGINLIKALVESD